MNVAVIEKLSFLHRQFQEDLQQLQAGWASQADVFGVAADDKWGGWGEELHFKFLKVWKETNLKRMVRAVLA